MIALTALLQELEYTCVSGTTDISITGVCYDTKKIEPGVLFVCIKGNTADSHDMINEIAQKKAAAVFVEREVPMPKGLTVIRVENTRLALALASVAYFGYPARKMKMIGITGTKGKTTVSYMIREMLKTAGYRTGLIGTIVTAIEERETPAGNTTPESYLIQETLAEMAREGCEYVVMEVSSQGLKLYRTAGIEFDVGVFTNLAPDHIGPAEHKDFAEYVQCKSRLFRQCRIGVVNVDDAHLEEVLREHTCPLVTYGMSETADYRAGELELKKDADFLGIHFQLNGRLQEEIQVGTPGRFSVYNALAAIGTADQLGLPVEAMKRALRKIRVKGRVERVFGPWDFTVLIDYAHNAMSLESLLTTLREYNPHRLICLFGCGGNRSKLRRYEMGEMSGRLADLTIITSDNPRFEEPAQIIADIRQGIERTSGTYVEIPDRIQAIAWALEHAETDDILVLAGKGHENYQEIRGVKYPLDERTVIEELLKRGK